MDKDESHVKDSVGVVTDWWQTPSGKPQASVELVRPVPVGTRFYIIPPAAQRQWVGLTAVELMNIVNKDQSWFGLYPEEVAHEVAKMVEAKLKEKNT